MSGRGAPALHHALAAYLNRVRGTSARPDHIVICNGYAQGIGLLIQTLATSGAKRLALEDPSADDDALPLARAAGLEVVGVPVDEDGVRIDALDRTDADALVLTPSHQWPTGAVLSAERRAAVLRWARERRALVDRGRLRRRVPLRPGSDRGDAGSRPGPRRLRRDREQDARARAATGLARRCRRDLVDAVADAKQLADRGSPVLDQLAFADFVDRGEFDRHLRRMRPLYRRRRDALLAALRRARPRARAGRDRRRAAPRRLPARTASTRRRSSRPPPGAAWPSTGWRPIASPAQGRPGLLFGYATLGERALAEGVEILAEAIADVRSRQR